MLFRSPAALDQLPGDRRELAVGQDNARQAVVESMLELGRRPSPVQRRGDRARRDRAENRLRAEGSVAAKDGDGVTGPNAEILQAVGHRPRTLGQLTVVEAVTVGDDRRGSRPAAVIPAQNVRNGQQMSRSE